MQIGDTVAVFAQGPIGLMRHGGARMKGASFVIAVESYRNRAAVSKMGADLVLNPVTRDVVAEIRRLTDGKGVDVAIEALGTQTTFENALLVLRAGGTLSSLGVYSGSFRCCLRLLRQVLETSRSSQPFAPVVKSECAGLWNSSGTAN